MGPPRGRPTTTPCRPRQLGEQHDRRDLTANRLRGFYYRRESYGGALEWGRREESARPAAPIDRGGSSALAADPIQQPIARAVPSGRTGQKGGAADTGEPTTPADRL